MRKLKLWNGRPYSVLRKCEVGRDSWHVYIAAYSAEDARRLCGELGLTTPSTSELRDYFGKCWGNAMDGITPERGVWKVLGYHGKPERITLEAKE